MSWFRSSNLPDPEYDWQSEIVANRVEQLTLEMAMNRRVPNSDGLPIGWFEDANAGLTAWYHENGGSENELWIYDLGCVSGFAIINGTRLISIFEPVERFPGGPKYSETGVQPKPLSPNRSDERATDLSYALTEPQL